MSASALERPIIAVAMLALFAFALQQTVVVPTLPALQREFSTSTAWSTWVITSFIFVGAITTPLVGRLADQFGRKPLLQVTIAIFTLASICGAFAPNIGVLIACRAVSGISGAFLALCLALATQHFRPERVGVAVSAAAAAMALGNIAGVTVGPIVSDFASWRWMFGVVGCIAALALVLSVRGIPGDHLRQRSSVDIRGAAVLALAIGSLMLGLTEANTWGWGSPPVVALFLASAASAVAWIRIETRVPEPMIDLSILRQRSVAGTLAATMLAGFGAFAWFMLVPRFVAEPRGLPPSVAELVPYGFGASSTEAGLFMLPAMLTALVVASFLGVMSARFGWRPLLFVGLCSLVVGYAGLALFHEQIWTIVVAMAICGIGFPISPVVGKIVSDDAPNVDHGVVMGLTMVGFYIGGVLGAQVCAAILTADPIAGTTTPSEASFTISFLLCSGAAAVAIPLAALAGARRKRRTAATDPAGHVADAAQSSTALPPTLRGRTR